jgi:hypothetical protein
MNYLSRNAQSSEVSHDEFELSRDDNIRETIRAFLYAQTKIHKASQPISEEWERLFLLEDDLSITDQFYVFSHHGEVAQAQAIISDHRIYSSWVNDWVVIDPQRLMHDWVSEWSALRSRQLFVWPNEGSLTSDLVSTPTQLPLSLAGSFSPSKKLAEFWVESITAMAGEAGILPEVIAVPPDRTEVQQEFAKTLISLFGTIGQKMRYGWKKDPDLTRNGEFTTDFEIQICDRFLIRPSRAAEFLALLRSELVAALEVGLGIHGAWGRIELNASGELSFVLEPPSFVATQAYEASEAVE